VTIQAQILKLMKDLSRDLGIAMVVIRTTSASSRATPTA
jgi:ABC-type dipeptide/oligopeptide/nickel transport system ATPase component